MKPNFKTRTVFLGDYEVLHLRVESKTFYKIDDETYFMDFSV